MTPEEAKALNALQDAELARLQADVARLAAQHTAPVFLAIISMLVERVCGAQGPHFLVHNKIRFYRAVLAALRQKGIS